MGNSSPVSHQGLVPSVLLRVSWLRVSGGRPSAFAKISTPSLGPQAFPELVPGGDPSGNALTVGSPFSFHLR
jgi:hypothetical protein